MIGNISSQIGRLAAVTYNHPVLIITIGGGLQPQGTILFVDVAVFLQKFAGILHLVRVQGTLAVPHIKAAVEGFQILLQGSQLFLQCQLLEDAHALILAHVQVLIPVLFDDALCRVDNIRTMVAVFREILFLSPAQKLQIAMIYRTCQVVDLIACIVDIILAGYRIACGTHDIHQRAAGSRAPAMAYMQRSGRIGTDILHLHRLHVLGRQLAECLPLLHKGSQSIIDNI